MKKFGIAISTIGMLAILVAVCESKDASDINAKVAQVDIDTATLDDVIRIFGEPTKYYWGNKAFTKDDLPSIYITAYPYSFDVVMSSGKVSELRFEGPDAGYVFKNKIKIGSSLEEVLDVIGQPAETIISQPCDYRDGILYKDINSKNGHCYYSRRDQGVRMFFGNYKVANLYLTSSKTTKRGSFQTVKTIKSVEEFDDLRCKDMSKLDFSKKKGLASTLTFNQKTVWPEQAKLPASCDPDQLLKEGMNPGLGIRKLHKQGITGKGVNVAIIDQPMYLDHPEFTGKIVAYHDVGCGSESSMHGPAVTSLLVGTNCGTAPGARVYYVAAPSWTKDAAFQAEALYWIIEQNEQLPKEKKIRVVSVSAAPSGSGSPFDKHNKMWDRACKRAENAGILVLDCTNHHGFIGACWYDATDPENVAKCTPGFRGRGGWGRPGCILVPTSPRTTAEEYDKGEFAYQYCGRGGLSWAIPYCAGVLALGWQVNPELSSEQMRDLLFKSAYIRDDGMRIINPVGFIQLVTRQK